MSHLFFSLKIRVIVSRHFFWCFSSPVGIPQILLMTKVDEACSLVADDLRTIYHSVYIQKKVNVTTSLQGNDGCSPVTVTEQ